MAATEPGHLEFRGDDATECETFISAVARQALAIGRQRDDQWVADFAASCFTQNALRWWNSLDEETQGSWRLLRNAMLSRYRPLFHGRDGEEAEKFVRMVRERALDEGKLNDNNWLVTFASTCNNAEADRHHAPINPSKKTNWTKPQLKRLEQYTSKQQEK
ncbi:hypothetical protein M407DRAFT_33030 [Tulasnella calospora MUT 4182]|uniref:Retrotransposon gag domain-containing protein n=1 Tax=Tulasnella calospora MUT 4182 TaxID=1051891 RepID=A0A0C3PRP6_9AGAM|nr:hypothetical protein M407DRAFT_33030 [Tulasnella calospora MUT 4182]